MKDFILENNNRYVEYKEFIKLSNQVNQNTKDIRETKETVMDITKNLTFLIICVRIYAILKRGLLYDKYNI